MPESSAPGSSDGLAFPAAHLGGASNVRSGQLVVVGSRGFIGTAILAEASLTGIPSVALSRNDNLEDVLTSADVLVNCTIKPEYKTGSYAEANDVEAITAAVAAKRNCRVIMLSTRRVYDAKVRWGATEEAVAEGDETIYGRNKSRTEKRIVALLGERACILRVSNAFGFEFTAGAIPRRSFFGLMLHRLKYKGEIAFDMHPDTMRDFIPVGAVAKAVVQAAVAGLSGTYNVGSGEPLRCGSLADAVIAGYGDGKLCAPAETSDEFYLDMCKWTERLGALCSPIDILETARMCGEKLRRE